MVLVCGSVVASAQSAPITLSVDLTDAPRKILHATEELPVQPGPLTVVYPKWIPGEHGPTGPIENMAGFLITADGKPVEWQRDNVDMTAFHLTVPDGVTKLDDQAGLPGDRRADRLLGRGLDQRQPGLAELEHAAGLSRWREPQAT